MQTISNGIAAAIILVLAFFAYACSDGNSQDDNDVVEGDDDGFDGGDADGDIGDGSDMPVCSPYHSRPWFVIADNYDRYSHFEDFRSFIYPNLLAECVMKFDEDQAWTVDCGEWSMWGYWLDENRSFPFADGQNILFYVEMYDDDIVLYAIWIFDVDKNLVMFEANTRLNPLPIYGDTFNRTGVEVPHFSDPTSYVCLYSPNELIPPVFHDNDGNWLRVYGRDAGGELFGSPFYVPEPGESAISDDGKLEVFNVHNFGGLVWTEDSAPDMPGPHEYFSEQTYIQAVAVE